METDKTYTKKDSFLKFENREKFEKNIDKKLLNLLSVENNLKFFNTKEKVIIERIKIDLLENSNLPNKLTLKDNTIAELNSFQKEYDIINYLIHRYKYEIFPVTKELSEFPPLVQIEPSSICNFRCVFCFETDKTFSSKNSGHMGTMTLEMFKNIIDEIEGKVQFVTLASRGEPLISKEIDKMIEYTSGKFLNLKINTNASLLNEKKAHAILSSNVKTLVFSADAADSDLYKKLRVNGNLETTLRNIKLFIDIKKKHYPENKIITRVSGVKFSKEQNFESMKKLWGELVDQIAFVDYNPWENSYEKKPNNIKTPCSDLWRRMFIWWDGKANPCDVDYKSHLCVGNKNNKTIKEIWNSKEYNNLRETHINQNRSSVSPCNACTVI